MVSVASEVFWHICSPSHETVLATALSPADGQDVWMSSSMSNTHQQVGRMTNTRFFNSETRVMPRVVSRNTEPAIGPNLDDGTRHVNSPHMHGLLPRHITASRLTSHLSGRFYPPLPASDVQPSAPTPHPRPSACQSDVCIPYVGSRHAAVGKLSVESRLRDIMDHHYGHMMMSKQP